MFVEKIKLFVYAVCVSVKNLFNRVFDYLLASKHRKQNLTIIGIMIFVNIIFLNTFFSYAYYDDYSSMVLVHATSGSKVMQNADYILLVYLENEINGGTYHLGESIPFTGYTYSNYSCQNNSTLVYNDNLKNVEATVTKKDKCSIYFNKTMDSDLNLLIKLEDSYNSNNYIDSVIILPYGYTYSNITCQNGSTVTYNEVKHSFDISATSKDTCNIYFKKDNTTNKVKLFIPSETAGEYLESNSFPKNAEYILNNKTTCKNSNGEIVNGAITYTSGKINITGSNLTCDVYVDVSNG